MGTSAETLRKWFQEGVKQQATHMIVVCDTFDWDDYPVYVSEKEDVRAKEKEYNGPNMQKVMEVYDLKKPMAPQMRGGRVFNY